MSFEGWEGIRWAGQDGRATSDKHGKGESEGQPSRGASVEGLVSMEAEKESDFS